MSRRVLLTLLIAMLMSALLLAHAPPARGKEPGAGIQNSLLTPRGGIEVAPLYVSTNGSVGFIHFLVIRACSGGCSQCPFSTYAGFLKCTIYSGSATGWFYPVFQFDGRSMALLNLPNTTCNYTTAIDCTTPLVNWTGREWRMYVWMGGDNVTVYRYYPERKCIVPEGVTNDSYRPFELAEYMRFSGTVNGTLDGRYVVFRFNGSTIRVPTDELLPALQYREMLGHLEAVEFKGGYLILLKDYEAFDASNFNYTGWAVFPNDCDVLKNETRWAKCVGEHLLRRGEIKPYPVFYYKNGKIKVFHPLEGRSVSLKACGGTSSEWEKALGYTALAGFLLAAVAVILKRKR